MAKKANSTKAGSKNSFVKIVSLAIIAFLLGSLAWYLGAPKKQVQENQVGELVSFVNGAASLVETKGEAAFTDFRQKDGDWWKEDKYIFVYDMDANTLVLPPTPEVEGTNRWTVQDANGVYYVREMVRELQSKNYVWVMYSYPKPGEKSASPKVAYVKKVTMGSRNVIVGSGIYY